MSALLPLAAAVGTGLAAAAVATLLIPPAGRLAPRVRPYALAARTSLGLAPDLDAVRRPGGWVAKLAERVGALADPADDDRVGLRLRQARLLLDVAEHHRVAEYRIRQLLGGVWWSGAGAAVLAVTSRSAVTTLLAALLGAVVGVTRWRARVDRTIDDRCARMRIELYTINQLLAMHVRVGGGVVQAVQRVVERGRGEVVAELADALAAHRSGLSATDAFTRAAELTPEGNAARTYLLLAASAEYGADLAQGLLALSESVRDVRREALRRQATRRRAAMLVPIIAVLAPVMLLFIAAPLPSLVFGVR